MLLPPAAAAAAAPPLLPLLLLPAGPAAVATAGTAAAVLLALPPLLCLCHLDRGLLGLDCCCCSLQSHRPQKQANTVCECLTGPVR